MLATLGADRIRPSKITGYNKDEEGEEEEEVLYIIRMCYIELAAGKSSRFRIAMYYLELVLSTERDLSDPVGRFSSEPVSECPV